MPHQPKLLTSTALIGTNDRIERLTGNHVSNDFDLLLSSKRTRYRFLLGVLHRAVTLADNTEVCVSKAKTRSETSNAKEVMTVQLAVASFYRVFPEMVFPRMFDVSVKLNNLDNETNYEI